MYMSIKWHHAHFSLPSGAKLTILFQEITYYNGDWQTADTGKWLGKNINLLKISKDCHTLFINWILHVKSEGYLQTFHWAT
jgi:hypothetical protein